MIRYTATSILVTGVAICACNSGGSGGSTPGPPPDPVLSAVLLPGPRITFARRTPFGGYEVLPSTAVILRLTSKWPLDGERVLVTVMSVNTDSPQVGPLSWVRTDDTNGKSALASAGYIETIVDGFGYSVIITLPPALRTGPGTVVTLRTSQGGTAASPTAYSTDLSIVMRPRVARTTPSSVFFDCGEDGEHPGRWHYNCKNASSIVARNVVLEGWLRDPRPNCLPSLCWEDWHLDFAPNPDFIEQMYGPSGAFPALHDETLTAPTTRLHGNPPVAATQPLADVSATTQQTLGITLNSFLLPHNVSGTTANVVGELNAWHPVHQTARGCILDLCRRWIGRGAAPAGWITLDMPATDTMLPEWDNTRWPYDPRDPDQSLTNPIADGQYVRLEGTLWQDSDHGDAAGGPLPWTRFGGAFGAWLEIHPIDWIVRMPEPTNPKSAHLVNLITWNPQTDSTVTASLSPRDANPGGAVLRCRELVDGRYTGLSTVVNRSTTVNATTVNVSVTARATQSSGAVLPGHFKAVYILWWETGGQSETACRQG